MEWEEKALLADPALALPHKILGQIYLDEKNDQKKALFYFRKYLQNAPNGPEKQEIQNLVNQLTKKL